MKTNKNLIKGIERSYTMTFLPIMLLYTFVVIVFASGRASNNQIEKDLNSIEQRNYSEFIRNPMHVKKANSTVIQQNKKIVNFDSLASIGKSHITSTVATMPVMNIKSDKEKSVEIESWMLDSKLFGQSINRCNVELDKQLVIEGWMLNSRNFGFTLETLHEENLQIEKWMTDPHLFGINSSY